MRGLFDSKDSTVSFSAQQICMEGKSISSTKNICSQDELDNFLYGYTKQGEEPLLNRTKLLNHGIERILEKKRPKFGARLPLDLPEGMTLAGSCVAGAYSCGVFNSSASPISRGTRYGPYNGGLVTVDQLGARCDNSALWEIYENGAVNHFVDGRRPDGTRCWMSLVRCARHPNEQNLDAVQRENRIYYEASKDIARGSELLVWYGDQYLQFMGVPVSIKDQTRREINDAERRLHEASDGFQCQRCGKVFAYRYYRDKHLKYTRCVDQGDRKFPCLLCSRSFEKKDRLRIHVLHVHEKHRPHKCSVCAKSFSQSSSLNKHMRVHSGERPYKCIYCSKAFTASSILRTHIRQHSGEKPFKCRHCGKAFASHAAHDSHVRRTHTSATGSTTCHLCRTEFARFQDLRKHCCTSKEPMFGSMEADDQSIACVSVVCSSRRQSLKSSA